MDGDPIHVSVDGEPVRVSTGGELIRVSIGGTPVRISVGDDRIGVTLHQETIRIAPSGGGVRFTVRQESFRFSSPPILSAAGWPFGPVTRSVTATPGATVEADRVPMPSKYVAVDWRIHLADSAGTVTYASLVRCTRKSGVVFFSEYGGIGDDIPWNLAVDGDGDDVVLRITNNHADALIVRTSKVGIFT